MCQSNPEPITVAGFVGVMPRQKGFGHDVHETADYRGLWTVTIDKQALEDIDRVITETEARLKLRPIADGARGWLVL